jgi:hypothetical protein
MNRRQFLVGCGVSGTIGLAGCSDPSQRPEDEDETSETPTRIISYRITGSQDPPQNPTVREAENGDIIIEGTTRVATSCENLVFENTPTVSEDGSAINVSLVSEDTSSDDVACTQAIQMYGYRVRLEVDGSPSVINFSYQAVDSNSVELEL